MSEFESPTRVETEKITQINHAIVLAGGRATRMGEGSTQGTSRSR
jgi:hypothetical protein